ncbi:MAG: hypothetical protein JWR38_1251 [Mucilaginibacter sp.]|nr:hypothetical protein [Mucilaginibacter sp.]
MESQLQERKDMFWIEVDKLIDKSYPQIDKNNLRKKLKIIKYAKIREEEGSDLSRAFYTELDNLFRRYVSAWESE